jgi:ferredoxin
MPSNPTEAIVRSGLEGPNIIANTAAFLSFFLLWATTLWGMVLRNSWAATRIKHSSVYGAHMTMALVGLSLGVVHACALEVIRGEQIRWVDLIIPFASRIAAFRGGYDYYYGDAETTAVDPIGISLGVVGLELMIAAAASVMIQRKLGYSRWRGLHSITYGAFSLLVAHVLVAGARSDPSWIWISAGACWLSTVLLWLAAPVWSSMIESRLDRTLPFGENGPAMTVNVDSQRCERAGFCVQAAPNVFQLRGEGRLTYRPTVDAAEVDATTRAAEICPVRAITLGAAPTAVVKPRSFTSDSDVSARVHAMTGRRDKANR